MTREEKQLLLKDLCARLPYGVKGRVYAECSNGEYDMNGDMIFFDSPFDVTLDDINISTEELHVTAIGNEDTIAFIEDQQTWGSLYTVDEFKPYLRPLSSMSDEEKKSLPFPWVYNFGVITSYSKSEGFVEIEHDECCTIIDWLNKKMFDYRGLIPKGQAISTEEFNPYKD